MTKLRSKTGLAVLMIGVSLSSWAGNPCMPIAQACMKLGYYKGGHNSGKGLIQDCVQPVATKSKTLPNTDFTDDMLQQCAAAVSAGMQGMQGGMQQGPQQ